MSLSYIWCTSVTAVKLFARYRDFQYSEYGKIRYKTASFRMALTGLYFRRRIPTLVLYRQYWLCTRQSARLKAHSRGWRTKLMQLTSPAVTHCSPTILGHYRRCETSSHHVVVKHTSHLWTQAHEVTLVWQPFSIMANRPRAGKDAYSVPRQIRKR